MTWLGYYFGFEKLFACLFDKYGNLIASVLQIFEMEFKPAYNAFECII